MVERPFYGCCMLERGCEGAVEMFLERTDATIPDRSHKYTQTPLSFAAEFRPEGVVDILMK